MKAIHNARIGTISNNGDVINHKITKLENNSQLLISGVDCTLCCYQSQNNKNWKQFTTLPSSIRIRCWLLSIIKLQNLKAIHNWAVWLAPVGSVVINHKTTKCESNSQHKLVEGTASAKLLSITKLQNLKAIHNFFCIKNTAFAFKNNLVSLLSKRYYG